ncbi:MAG: peptidoglycan-binding protein LysM [Acidobacteriota bacterium]|nr:peptidoglycan-binding protein LysM [Acidobacteriota bacterium]
MGLFDFVKDAGEKIFGVGDEEKHGASAPQRSLDVVLADKSKGEALKSAISKLDLGIQNLRVSYRDGLVTLSGAAPSQAVREKAVLLAGNTAGVGRVDDQLTVERPEPEARMYTVIAGDSLSRIAKQFYGDAKKYPVIFEANRPMLKDPNKIYPGQVLRIPPTD